MTDLGLVYAECVNGTHKLAKSKEWTKLKLRQKKICNGMNTAIPVDIKYINEYEHWT